MSQEQNTNLTGASTIQWQEEGSRYRSMYSIITLQNEDEYIYRYKDSINYKCESLYIKILFTYAHDGTFHVVSGDLSAQMSSRISSMDSIVVVLCGVRRSDVYQNLSGTYNSLGRVRT